jgi:hypothetical protein
MINEGKKTNKNNPELTPGVHCYTTLEDAWKYYAKIMDQRTPRERLPVLFAVQYNYRASVGDPKLEKQIGNPSPNYKPRNLKSDAYPSEIDPQDVVAVPGYGCNWATLHPDLKNGGGFYWEYLNNGVHSVPDSVVKHIAFQPDAERYGLPNLADHGAPRIVYCVFRPLGGSYAGRENAPLQLRALDKLLNKR